jgi:site-specific DNA-methyltransferase (adenine-specific)
MNQVICGDCLVEMPKIADKSIDMILCDLPYGTTDCKWDTIIPFEPLWEQYKRLIKDNGAIVLTASQPFTSALVMSNIKWFKYCWYWKKSLKTNFLNAKKQPLRQINEIAVFYNNQCAYNPQGVVCGSIPGGNKGTQTYGAWNSDGYKQTTTCYPSDILEIPCGNTGSLHPTQKPVALFEYLIRTYTNEGDTVLDNCAGSGTTGVACLNTGRGFILIEKEPEYVEIIRKRLSDHLLSKEQQLKI